jgi:hypothetical protein
MEAGMAVHEIQSQSARTDTGVTLRSVDRENMRAEYRGRGILLGVERGVGTDVVYLPKTPAWEDGEPIAAADLTVVKDGVVEILRYWGSATEFYTLSV